MAVTELVEPMRPVMRAAVERAALGEDVVWDVTWSMVQTPTGPQTVFMCYVHCAALHTLGAMLQRAFPVPIGATPEVVERIISEQVRELFAERSRLLTQSQSNGAGSGKIVLPRQPG